MTTIRRSVWLVTLLLLLPGESPAQANAQAILDRMIERFGGPAFLDVTGVRSTGRYYQFQREDLASVEVFVDYLQFPDKERTEFGRNASLIRINNGREGWNIVDKKVEAQLPEQIALFWEEFKVSLDYLLRVVIHEPGTSLQHVGRDMIDFKRVDVLEIRDEDRTRINLYIDDTGLLMKKTVRRLDSPSVHEEVYSNYHEFQGVLTPLLIHRYTSGAKTAEIRFEQVAYNERTPDNLFRPEQEP